MNTADFIENFGIFENRTNRLIELVNREINKLPTRIDSIDNMDPVLFNQIYNNLQRYSLELEMKMETIRNFLRNRRKRPRYMIGTLNNLYNVEILLDTTFTRMESIIRKRRGPIYNRDDGYGNENFGKSRTTKFKSRTTKFGVREMTDDELEILQVLNSAPRAETQAQRDSRINNLINREIRNLKHQITTDLTNMNTHLDLLVRYINQDDQIRIPVFIPRLLNLYIRISVNISNLGGYFTREFKATHRRDYLYYLRKRRILNTFRAEIFQIMPAEYQEYTQETLMHL